LGIVKLSGRNSIKSLNSEIDPKVLASIISLKKTAGQFFLIIAGKIFNIHLIVITFKEKYP